ncbi:unnamed protein product [Candidula unifasciata]|uniref:Ricin B lectin domain-containing protein n=1 Tax=Candidula unifasciata TaxID=100452 RepID=A0A8S3ZSF9_9EUPU|nr:unnamed protein product [Candidula unifasciata]
MGGPEQNQHAPKMFKCHGLGYKQFWYFSGNGQIYQDDWHICVSNGQIVTRNACIPDGAIWKYREDKTILHIPTNQCLTASVTRGVLSLANCSDSNYQKWEIQPRRTDVKFPSVENIIVN